MDKVIITTFTDPMMGLTYEMEPTYEKLEKNFPEIEFRWVMSLLVRDVSDFMLPGETIPQYNSRLAKIYESEHRRSSLQRQPHSRRPTPLRTHRGLVW